MIRTFKSCSKVKADFDTAVDRTPENEQLYARFIGRVGRERDLAPFSPDAVARVIEHCSRQVADQRKMTTRFMDVVDLLTESSYWAQRGRQTRRKPVVRRAHVQKAIDERIYRSNQLEQRVREAITDATLMVDTRGAVVGQVNGLSVSSIGDYAFGRPSRITATHRLGDGELIDIEREVEMGGPIHSKGVLILAGYLGAKYAPDRPLSLSARLVSSNPTRAWREIAPRRPNCMPSCPHCQGCRSSSASQSLGRSTSGARYRPSEG